MTARAVTCTVCELHAESTFTVEGMDCREEVAMIERRFKHLAGLEDFSVDLIGRRLHVKYDAAKLSASAIADAVADAGMRAWLEHEEPIGSGADAAGRWRQVLVWISGAALLAGLLADALGAPAPLSRAAFAMAVAAGGSLTVRKAWHAARLLSLDINVLMLVAAAGAVGLGQWAEAAAVVFLFAVAQALEVRTLERARGAIQSLMDLTPTEALVRDAAGERRVDVEQVDPGSVIVVRPGDKIPLDGEVVAGTSAVNQAPITGESMPVEKEPGAEVFAGTINGDGTLTVEAMKEAEDTKLARIIRMVEAAHAQRAPSEQWVERFARIYTPAIMVLALLVFLAPPLLLGGAWADWFYRALVLLVIACPCALVISTPVSVVAALASAARAGVLVKGGAFIELPARLRASAMDKTGTITLGEPRVVRIVPLNDHTEAQLLASAAALEARSTHPLARAVVSLAERRGIAPVPATDAQVLKGKGVTGTFDGERFWLGSHRYAVERGQDSPVIAREAESMERDGKTVVVIGNARHVCGLIAVADTIRPEAREVVSELHAAGIAHVVMLTGDNRATAEAIAREVGIDEVHAELLPEEKLARIEELVRRYGTVAMVGDGVNDAPALARANLGIAMGAIGSDAAIETADVALMTDDISKLPWLVRHAKRTLSIIHQNIGVSLAVKAVFVALTFAGLASLWGAIAADEGAALLVVMNALRLSRTGASAQSQARRLRMDSAATN